MIDYFNGIKVSDGVLKEKLKAKLNEYDRRVKENDLISHSGNDAEIKAVVLRYLLKKEQVTTEEVYAEVLKKIGTVSNSLFSNACDVISDYCKTGGQNNLGGKGLPTS